MAAEFAAPVKSSNEDSAAELQTAITLHRGGRLDEAETIYRRLLETRPNHPNALHLLGAIQTERGAPERGIEMIRQAFPALNESPEAHIDLGNALRLSGRVDDAIDSYRRALAVQPDHVQAHICLGSLLTDAGRFEAALGHCRTALAISPKSMPARVVMALALQGARRLPEAGQVWREIINLQPDNAVSYHQLAAQLIGLGAYKEALFCSDRAIALKPDEALFHCARGHALMRLFDGDRAEASFRRAISLAPDNKEGWLGLAWALRLLGRFDEADDCVQRAQQIDPHDMRGVAHLPATGGDRIEGVADIDGLAAVLENTKIRGTERAVAGFALGKLLEKGERYDEAFETYVKANTLVRQNWPAGADHFEAGSFSRTVDALIATNTLEGLSEAARTGSISELPVLIIGMPRSGTTLVEQICASHSRVHGAGELDSMSRIALALAPLRNDQTKLSQAARRTADAHIRYLHSLGRGAARVTDKMPDNILLVGVIARLFPRARFIYCSRDPRDIALSCFFQRFSTGAQYFSYDLADCGHRCRDIQRLAAHWLKLLPHHMIEVNYEELVADLEGESKRIIDFLGLPWEPACLDFHRTERTVATVSHWQVRQPIYSSSIGRWKKYEKHLGALFAALDDSRAAASEGSASLVSA